MVRLIVNGVERQVDADPDMPLLWALRDVIHRSDEAATSHPRGGTMAPQD